MTADTLPEGSLPEATSPPLSSAEPVTQKPTFPEFLEQSLSIIGHNLSDPKYKVHFDAAAISAVNYASEHAFFSCYREEAEKAAEDYKSSHSVNLLMKGTDINLFVKSYDSLLQKVYRFNVVQNDLWPQEPEKGWVTPDNWYTKINDIVRGEIVTKFADGPQIVLSCLKKSALCSSVKFKDYTWQQDDGYYAIHFYASIPVKIIDFSWNEVQLKDFSIEIQVLTQMHDLLRKLLHKYYEDQRVSIAENDQSWKWRHKENRFKASYLGHALHLLEGIIVEVRDSAR